ncbi:hypothetical protein [Providencia rettgeri]|uniref:hypothetical protein n=1 Tax=Providencia rettgeri TaxID=587 RepID=UPI001F338D22|nr:hypothetical protein [Providencia rettgeri]
MRNKNNVELGIVGEQGIAWIVGVTPKELLDVYWGNKLRCNTQIPEITDIKDSNPTLICR